MKMSFSLSSLHPSKEHVEGSKQAKVRVERPYNSLTKKRKEPEMQENQRVFASQEDGKDDFWAAIRSNYDYIMDTNLIDSCKEANPELTWDENDVSTLSWGLKELNCQFHELYSWLRDLQELVYSKEENLHDKNLRATHMEELRRKAYRKRLFNEQAEKLLSRAPELKDEVAWRVDHLNAKWELVEQIMAPVSGPETDQQDVSADFEHEVKCLRKWLREMEARLQPLSLRVDWTRTELEEKAVAHMVLQRDIEAHGRIVSSVVKLGERVSAQNHERPGSSCSQNPALRVVSSLEHRWHLLFLRALEWQCHIETLALSLCKNFAGRTSSSDSEEEPVTKHPRLSQELSRECNKEDDVVKKLRPGLRRRNCPLSSTNFLEHRTDSDSEASTSSENRFNDDGSYFEDELEKLCVMDTIFDEAKRTAHSAFPSEGDNVNNQETDSKVGATMPPTPNPVPMATKSIEESCDEIDGARANDNSNLLSSPMKCKIQPDSDESFNSSIRSSKNCATFYFKHLDTDSEAECCVATEDCPIVVDDSSEEEWTYTKSTGDEKSNVKVRPEETSVAETKVNEMEVNKVEDEQDSDYETKNEKIRRLIREVEKLVREENRVGTSRASRLPPVVFENKPVSSSQSKYARIKEWLKLHPLVEDRTQVLDSCDASGEYTTGDSDGERYSISSEDVRSSVVTCRRGISNIACSSQTVSQEIVYTSDHDNVSGDNRRPVPIGASTPKVVMRSKRKSNDPRPWSVSCISQIRNGAGTEQSNDPISQFSISETALHQIVAEKPTKSASFDETRDSCGPITNSTSTLMEETVISQDDRVMKNSSLRRKKNRLRKKAMSRKSESGSDVINATHNHSGGSDGSSNHPRCTRKANRHRQHGHLNSLYKSESFSGYAANQELSIERSSASDPTPQVILNCRPSVVSSSDSEEDDHARMRYCAQHKDNIIESIKTYCDKSLCNADSDIEKCSVSNTSFSENAWDNYQDKYNSENYSEAPDDETMKRLLEFGDDYRNFLDSQSDCASSLSAIRDNYPRTTKSRMHHKTAITTEDSDSDVGDAKVLVQRLFDQLIRSENRFLQLEESMTENDYVELTCTCSENINCLRVILDSGGANLRLDKHSKQFQSLMERWESLSNRVDEVKKAKEIQREMANMHLELRSAKDRILAHEITLEQPHVLDDRINRITTELAMLREHKNTLLNLNLSSHRLITDSKTTRAFCSLKDDIADLYRIWDETVQLGNHKLSALQDVLQFGVRLSELQCALRRDKDTLDVLDVALQDGATVEVASSVRDVARLLSEKQDSDVQSDSLLSNLSLDDSKNSSSKFTDVTLIHLTQEGGSLSDSGISDSGSEQELSERERRLAALRRLTRTLESQLAPGSEAFNQLLKRVDDVEAELRCLQDKCRELIVRTAASVESRSSSRAATQAEYPVLAKRKKSHRQKKMDYESRKELVSVKHCIAGSGDPESEPGVSQSWVWRILRAALPFQLALLALFCAACLLEPNCCEATNSLNLSFTPQLHYVRGPPPV